MRTHAIAVLILFLGMSLPAHAYEVTFGNSWSGYSLQDVLDWTYGPGAVNAATDYSGYHPLDPDVPYWFDSAIGGLIVKEIAGFADLNTMGWYEETELAAPVIDGSGDGVIFTGPMSRGQQVVVQLPKQTKFGLWLNPNGNLDSHNAPEGEFFFTNRYYNDLGADGSGAIHAPFDGDVQALIYDIRHLRGGVPTYVIAWEDLDSGAPITESYDLSGTDNDFTDLVVEISAFSPVPIEETSFSKVKSLFGD